MRKLAIMVLIILFTGCATFNDMLTPTAKIKRDAYDGSVSVYQEEVSAASSLSEAYTFMGFTWHAKNPKNVVIYAGVYTGWLTVTGVRFKIEDTGEEITAYSGSISISAKQSGKHFNITLEDFEKIANANSVLMKLEPIGAVSSFGKNHDLANVTAKLNQFLEEITIITGKTDN